MNLFHDFPVLAIHMAPSVLVELSLRDTSVSKIASGSTSGKIPRVHELR